MSSITRGINLNINAPAGGAQTAFDKLAEAAKRNDSLLQSLNKNIGDLGTATERFGRSADQAFASLSTNITRAGQAVDALTAKLNQAAGAMERLGGAGGGIGGGMVGGGGGAWGSRGMGRMMRMAGHQFGMGPLSGMTAMGPAGMALGIGGSLLHNYLEDQPGKQAWQQQHADMMANQQGEQRTNALMTRASDVVFNASQPLAKAFDPFGKTDRTQDLALELKNLDAQREIVAARKSNAGSDALLAEQRGAALSNRAAVLVGKNTFQVPVIGGGRDFDQNMLTGQFGKSQNFRQQLGGVQMQRDQEIGKAAEYRKEEQSANEKLLAIDGQRVEMNKKLADTIMQQVKERKSAFSHLDASQRLQITDYARRAQKGENFVGGDREALNSFGPLGQDILGRQDMKEVTNSGEYLKFAQAAGDDMQQQRAEKATKQAQEAGVNVDVRASLDPDVVAKKIVAGMGGLVKDVEVISRRVNDIQAAQRLAAGQARAGAEAVAPQ